MNNVCDNYCEKCYYCSSLPCGLMSCNYFLVTSVRRPCPPGKGCKVRVLDKKKTWKELSLGGK